MKGGTVFGRPRTDRGGNVLVNVKCPRCSGRHWLPAAPYGYCPRNPRRPFAITREES